MTANHDPRSNRPDPRVDSRLSVADGVNYQAMGDGEDGVILSLKSGCLYRCNHTAIAILDMLRDRPTVDALLEGFAGRFALDVAQARADVLPLVRHLVEQQIIEKVA